MKKDILLILFLLLVTLAVLSPVAPLYQPIPARDQGVYLYIGQQVLDGAVPYRDVWDHKGPLIYYINAFGLLLTNSIWGVWFVEIIFLFISAVLGFLALRMVFDSAVAFSSTILWLVTLPEVLDHGGSVEEYSLLFQFAAIYFYARLEKNSKSYWNEILIGMMAAMAFSLRPNNIGVHVTIGLVLAAIAVFSSKERILTVRRGLGMVLGAAIVFGVIGIYFASNKSLGFLLDALFIYNYHYSKLETISWQAVTKGFTVLAFLIPFAVAGMIGAISYLYGYWKYDKKDLVSIKARFALFALMAVPIQFYLSLLSGRKYMHYYIAWLPVLTLLTGFFIFWLQQWAGRIFPTRYKSVLNVLIAGGLILAFGIQPAIYRVPLLVHLFDTILAEKSLPPPDYSAVEGRVYIEYILSHTQPDDYVLIWGNASVYNFLTERKSPSRFVYTYAFGVPSYVSQEMVDELLLEIIEKKPMIIDATAKDKTIGGINLNAWEDIPVTQDLIRFIEENYVRVDIFGPERFRIWVYKGE